MEKNFPHNVRNFATRMKHFRKIVIVAHLIATGLPLKVERQTVFNLIVEKRRFLWIKDKLFNNNLDVLIVYNK